MQRIILFFIIFSFTFIINDNLSSLNNPEIANRGKVYCVIIALDQYKNRLTLENHKSNAIKLKNILYNNYEVDEVFEIYDIDATKEKIESLFLKLNSDLKKEDSLILYYSGRSYIDIIENESYWLPYDAGINEYSKEYWISNKDIINYLSNIIVNQFLFINDANFNLDYIELIDLDDSIKFTTEYYEKAYSKRTRQFLGSGISEIGIIKSDFTEQLISVLEKMKGNYIDSINIFNEIKSKLKESTPILGSIKNIKHEKGASFVLLPRKEELVKIEKEEVIKKEDKVIEKEKEVKKEEKGKTIIYQPQINLKSINIAGNVLLPIGATISTVGISFFIIDLLILFPVVKEKMYYGTTYADYEFYYNLNLTIFSTSIAATILGLGLTAAGIGLKIYAFRQKKLSLNMEYNNSVKLYFTYKF